MFTAAWQRSRPTSAAFKISFHQRRNDRTIDLPEQTKADTNKYVIRYSIHIKIVPWNEEEEEEEKTTSKQTNKTPNQPTKQTNEETISKQIN